MRTALKTMIYVILTPILLWIAFIIITYFITFSYGNNFISKVLYILIGNWVPGKLYGLNLFHSFICVFSTFFVIAFLDNILSISPKTRLIILIIISVFFLYEAFFNFFMQNEQQELIPQFRQIALIQISFLIGILIKAFKLDS